MAAGFLKRATKAIKRWKAGPPEVGEKVLKRRGAKGM